jgi:uncharacterized protein (DUF169 family)
MESADFKEMAGFLSNNLRLRTLPLAVKFLKSRQDFPVKTRQPSVAMGKRVSICQGVTMARVYGWTVGLTRDDLICVPAMIAFGFSDAPNPAESLTGLFCEVDFASDREGAAREVAAITRLENQEYDALVLAPLEKGLFEPDTVVIYGNPAQIMRLVMALVYIEKRRIDGNFGGKVECTEYLLAPFKTQSPRVVIPGMGDRIFSMTQDDEMVLSIPGGILGELIRGLEVSGKKIGARYPVTFYQNFQPEYPKAHQELGKALGLF